MITNVEYMQIVNEVYDLSDYKTQKAILFCNEAEKVNNVEHIVGRLYQHIKNDVNAIDFRSIAKSKGVISRVDNYDQMIDCINVVADLVRYYNERTTPIDIFSTAIENIKSRERYFTKAFALNIEMPMIIYNTTVMAIVSSISLLITASIEFIKDGHESFKASLDRAGYKKTQNHMMYDYLNHFNKICASGELDKLIDSCIKNNMVATKESVEIADGEIIDEGIIGTLTTKGVGKLSLMVIPKPVLIAISTISIILLLWKARKIIFYWYRGQMKLSDWFEAQATLLQISAENLKNRDDGDTDEHKKKVYKKQIKWVERFKKISNFLALKDSKVSKEVNDKENESRHKRHVDDDTDDNTTSNDDSLF